MPNVFDEVATTPKKKNVFDEVDQPRKNVFDEVSSENDFTPEMAKSLNPGGIPAGTPMGSMQNSSEGLREVVNDPSHLPSALLSGAMLPLSIVGKYANAAVQDAATTLTGNPEYGGNLLDLATRNEPGGLLPYEKTLAEISKSNPVVATAGKAAAGLTETAPALLAMPGGAAGKGIGALFGADMLANAPEAARSLGEELGKPEDQRDYDKITSATSQLAQTAAFAPLAGTHAFGKTLGEKLTPATYAARALAEELKKSPNVEPPQTREGLRQLGIRLPDTQNVLGTPELATLADQAIKEQQSPIKVPGQVPAIDLIRNQLNPDLIQGVEPVRAAERISGGGEAPYGKVSYQRGAEAPLPERTQNALDTQATQAVRSLRDQPQQGQGEMPGKGAGAQVDVGGGKTAPATEIEKGVKIEAKDHPEVAAKAPELLPEIVKDELREDPKFYKGEKAPEGQLSVAEAPRVTRDSILEMSPEDYFNTSRKWAQDSMAGKGESVQVQAEIAALREPDVAAWKSGYEKATQEAQSIRAEIKANPASMADPKVQARFAGAAQKAQFFSEGIKVLEGTSPQKQTIAALQREGAMSQKSIEMSEPIPVQELGRVVNEFADAYPGAPKINIALDHHGLPDTLHQLAYSQGANPIGIRGAVTKGGDVWLNRQMLDNPADARQTILHEIMGHMAVNEKLGKRLDRFMEQVHDSMKDTEVGRQVADLYPKADSGVLGREIVAKISETFENNPNLWNKVVANFRQFLRDIGWVKKVTDNDINVMLRGAIDGMKRKSGEASSDGQLSLKSAAEAANERYPNEQLPKDENKPVLSGGKQGSVPAVGEVSSSAGKGGGLSDIYKIFEPEKKPNIGVKQRAINVAESFRTGISSKFRPVNKLAEDIAKSYGLSKPKDIAGIMEQLKGSQGKGEADIYRFDRDVSDLVKGDEKDFNAYMFLRRSLDRLNQDAKDIEAAQGGADVAKLNRRAVGGYTINELTPKLKALEEQIGPEKLANFSEAANRYQGHMDQALRLQVESGRMSPEVYQAIKEGNQFYAPFKVMKYLEESGRPQGSGKRIDTMADFTKAMKGIEDPDFKLGDMLSAARQGILMSRILADKNVAMRHVAALAPFDADGMFIRKLAGDADAPRGFEAVNVLENGKQERYAVRPEVAEAIQLYGGTAGGVVSRMLGAFSVPFRAGATAFNIPFQVSNLLADVPRQALISKYGIRGVNDLWHYPADLVKSIMASIQGDMFGKDNKLFLDFLDSGAAGTTVQSFLTPEALKFKEPTNISKSRQLASSVLNLIPHFAQAIEQTSKILGVQRAMRFHGAESGKQLARQIPEAITEIRRFSGSPDFGRQGKWVEQARLNLLYMFLNARIQGAIADVGRLTGRDGASTAASTWFKVTTAVGIPTAYLYYLNNTSEYKDDYDKRPAQEKQNYWLIPKDKYITNDDGEKVRDYWRIPKRESSKWIANLTESALNFAQKKDPKAAIDFGKQMLQEISPVNIQGNTAQERLESIASSLNPVIKAPLELASGRDLYRHRSIIPDSMKNASPEEQYTPATAEVFKKLAQKIPDIAPDVLRSPLMLDNLTRNLTAGLITQFLPRKPIQGRSGFENSPLLSRFQAIPYNDNEKFKEELQELEREAADEQLNRHREATKLIDDNPGKTLSQIVEQSNRDPRLIKHLADLWVAKQNGITSQERQLLSLPARQRAAYVENQLHGLTPDAKTKVLQELARKRILTEAVMQEMTK